jgi:hypothetical protein
MDDANSGRSEQLKRFQSALGSYIMNTASTESQFLTIMRLALRDTTDAPAAIWLQFSSTRARLEMVVNIYRSRFGQSETTDKITRFATTFKGLTRQRNFYCHSVYFPEAEKDARVVGYEVTEGEQVVRSRERKIGKDTCNEIAYICQCLQSLNDEMWNFITAEQTRLLKIGAISEPFAVRPLSLLAK